MFSYRHLSHLPPGCKVPTGSKASLAHRLFTMERLKDAPDRHARNETLDETMRARRLRRAEGNRPEK